MKTATQGQRTMASTFLVGACTFLSRIMGFVRMALIGAIFGAGGAADVFAVVFNIPNNLRKLLAEGALSSAFIPELSRVNLEEPGGGRARSLAREILGLQILIIAPLLLVSEFFPEATLRIFENFRDPGKTALAIGMFRLMAPYLLLVSVSALMMGVHNTHERFFIPAVTPILFSVAVIGTMAFGADRWGPLVIGGGVLAGGAAQILFQWPTYKRLGYSLLPRFRFGDPAFRRVMRRWGPVMLTSSLFMVNSWIANLIATGMADKSVSALLYAVTLWQLPFGLFSTSLSTVLYPRMSRESARNDREALAGSLGFGYRVLFALLVPSALVLIVLGRPIVAVVYQRGALAVEDTLLIAKVTAAYAVGMPFVGLFNFAQRGFYSIGDTRSPFSIGLVTIVIDIVLSLAGVYGLGMDVSCLAWANTAAFLAGTVLMTLRLRRSVGFAVSGATGRTFGKVIAVNAAVGALAGLASSLLGSGWWRGGSSPASFGILAAIGVPYVALILALYGWMGVDAVSIILKRGKLKAGAEGAPTKEAGHDVTQDP